MRWTRLRAAALALLLGSAACGPAPSDRDSSAAAGLPDGQLLLATGEGTRLYWSSGRERSVDDAYPFGFSPDGSRVLAARSRPEATGITRKTELVAIDPNSEAEHVIVRAGDRETLDAAEWSPDGSRIVYRVTTYEQNPSDIHPGDGEGTTESVCVHALSGSGSRCFDPPRPVSSFDWSNDSRSVLIAGPGTEPVFALDVASGEVHAVISPGGDEALRAELERLGYGRANNFVHPQWSASGRYLAALVSLGGGSRAFVPAVFTFDGEFVSLGRPSGEFPDAFGWAPERDILAYTVAEAPYGVTDLFVHDPTTGRDHLLTTTENERPGIPRIDGVVWSPDGRWVALSRPQGIRLVDVEGEESPRELDVQGTVVDWASNPPSGEDPPSLPSTSPSPEQSSQESSEYVGFHPESRVENGQIVMPLTFVDGSSGEVIAPPELGIQEMSAAIYTVGGLGSVDRTMNFRYGEPAGFVHEGPLETYEGYDGQPVEVWKGTPGDWECPNLVFRFEDWYVGVRTCQRDLSAREKELWARSLRGDVTTEGFLVLSSEQPLVLQETGGHEGPEIILGMDRANWIELEPGRCDPADLPDEGDVRTMPDGTRVSFSRIGNGNSGIEYDWFAAWCEDGLMRVQVSHAYQDFVVAAAEGFRRRGIAVAE